MARQFLFGYMHQGCVLVLFFVLAAIAAVFVMKNEENDATENTGERREIFSRMLPRRSKRARHGGKPVCPKSRPCDS